MRSKEQDCIEWLSLGIRRLAAARRRTDVVSSISKCRLRLAAAHCGKPMAFRPAVYPTAFPEAQPQKETTGLGKAEPFRSVRRQAATDSLTFHFRHLVIPRLDCVRSCFF